ncbi:MAG TPA: tRNA lysidine(34) synthetase TilS [Burkholderiaceae bacterium]|jgi:tRNA(Ile)-lysidine synthase
MEARAHFLHDVVARSMAEFRERFQFAQSEKQHIAVAYSGGLDSTVLLHLMREYAGEQGIHLHAFHVHHGLSPHADRWLEHCRQTCVATGVEFDARLINVGTDGGDSIEEVARDARYAALGAMCREHGVPLLVTAHHVDDQAETILLQMLRGAGLAGISGMDCANLAPRLLGSDTVVIARPLLAASRSNLEDYARRHGIANIEDESNIDPRFARNALRHQVMPALQVHFPGFQQRFARTAQHAGTAQGLLNDLAEMDLATCRIGDVETVLDVDKLGRLSAARADNMLRYWFSMLGLRMPSTAWLQEMRTQLLVAKADAQLCVTHADCHIRRHRNRVYVTLRDDAAFADIAPQNFVWNGETSLNFPDYRGSLHFDAARVGIAAAWLRGRQCCLHFRQGGERLKLAPDRPTRSLKQHYQANDVPAWERETLPLVSSGSKLLFAVGLGMDSSRFGAQGEPCVTLRWKFDDVRWRPSA